MTTVQERTSKSSVFYITMRRLKGFRRENIYSKFLILCCACALVALVYMMHRKRQETAFLSVDSLGTSGQLVPENPVLDTKKYQVKEQALNPHTIAVNRDESFDYKAAMKKLNEEKVAQDDPRLITLIRNYYIDPPSAEPYNLKNSKSLDYSMGQAPFVDSRLNYMEGGFYIECGALDGETRSNTLFFEKVRRWNGLLVEADPSNYARLRKKHRKAFAVNACLNTEPHPAMRTFKAHFNLGRLGSKGVEVQCFPLYSLMLALNQTKVDFFSLDVEGDELAVLQTIPIEKTDIKMMTVEFVHDVGGEASILNYGKKNGYLALIRLYHFGGLANDIIFRKRGLSH